MKPLDAPATTATAARLSLRATIAVDAGTTAYAVVQGLPDSFRGTVVTHSIPVMQLMLARGLGRVVGLGGELLPESQAFIGPRTVDAVAGLRVQTLLLGAAAVDEQGTYVSTDNERPTKLALMSIADRVVLLVDSSKFLASAPVHLCGWDEISAVVTDAPPPTDVVDRLPRLAEIVEVAGRR
jgi:DeoR/GlpR family transcriptional regulator of sugar metabolism